ncbi:glycosyltransferase [Motilimonas pumila]|uniref:Glycosyltransferase family 2 protein n=1 Tax=Motilimonas pumila TaxID=2303987 RepID=A0A418YJ53_9GAMM|nr:glycosyltransferase family 2 protein [Motilimonas pumila]RJG50639.1 glycosyltransferase family 2 protein [Motilimonas pumila]
MADKSSEEFELVITIFAYNEADSITRCLESVANTLAKHARFSGRSQCVLVANGCRDNTVDIANQFALQHPWLKVVDICLGDKCNAWNEAVHQHTGVGNYYVFLDGDCFVGENAISNLVTQLEQDPRLNACSAVPQAKYSLYRKEIVANGGIAGCLYALNADFVARIRQQNIRLPVGFIGDDSLVGALAHWNLEPLQNSWDKSLTQVCAGAEFSYDTTWLHALMSPRFYLRRCQRYSMRYFQNKLLSQKIYRSGLAGIPEKVEQLYWDAQLKDLKLRKSWRYYLFDRQTVNAILSKQRNV